MACCWCFCRPPPKTRDHHTRHTVSGRSRPASVKSIEINMIAQSIHSGTVGHGVKECDRVKVMSAWCVVCGPEQKRCNQARVRCILENGAEIYDVDYIFFPPQVCSAWRLVFCILYVGIPAARYYGLFREKLTSSFIQAFRATQSTDGWFVVRKFWDDEKRGCLCCVLLCCGLWLILGAVWDEYVVPTDVKHHKKVKVYVGVLVVGNG